MTSSHWKRTDRNFRLVENVTEKSGAFGKVYKAVSTLKPGHEYAIKKIGIATFTRKIQSVLNNTNLTRSGKLSSGEKYNWIDILQVLLNEINNLALNTEFIVRSETCWFEGVHEKFFNNLNEYCSLNNHKSSQTEVTIDGGGSSGPCVDSDFLYIPMEWCDLDLTQWIFKNNGENNNLCQLYSIWKNVLEGLKELHRNNIIHRDIKPENILLKYETGSNNARILYKAKIGDFGLSTIIKDPQNRNNWQKCTVGTDKYMSPEMKEGKGNYNEKTDVFSAGLTFMECLWVGKTGYKIDPFLFDEFRNGEKVEFLKGFKERELISSMCEVDLGKRGSASSFLPLVEDLEKKLEESSSVQGQEEGTCAIGSSAENIPSILDDVDNSPSQLLLTSNNTRTEEYKFVTYSKCM